MKRCPPILPTLLLATVLAAATPAAAGQNAGSHARLYWHVGSGPGLSSRDTQMDSLVELVVTVTGVKSLRGADVQLSVQGADGLPRAWQAQVGGCAQRFATLKAGGFGGAYPNLFATGAPVPNLITVPPGMYYQYKRNMCATPDSTGLLWLSAAGAAGAERDSSVEYAVFAVKFDLKSAAAACAGPATPADARGVTIYANNHIPCTRTAPKVAITLLDNWNMKDYVPVDSLYSFLTWKGGAPAGARGGR